MATDRSPIAYIWPTLKAFATGDVITRELLRDSINKAGDIGYGVLAALNERFQQLGSTNAGTSAVQRGSVVMGGLSFYDPVDVPVGALDGLTLILETDLAGPVTITFVQPTSPVHVATQINTQGASLGIVASCDTGVDPNTGAIVAANVGKLLLVRPSGGTASLTVKGSGTANAILGLPLIDTTTTGAGTANDGASRVGVADLAAISGGTLRAVLLALESAILGIDNSTSIAFGGTLLQMSYSIPGSLLTSKRTVLRVPNLLASYVYTLPAPPGEGYSVILLLNPNPPQTLELRRPDTSTIAIMSGEFGTPSPGQQYIEIAGFGGVWYAIGWGINDDSYALPS
jgi:hypothetical protein